MAVKIDGVVKEMLCYNIEETAEVLGVSTARVRQMRAEEKIKGFQEERKGPKGRLYFAVSAIEEYKLHKNDPKPAPVLVPAVMPEKPRKRAQKR